MHIDSTDVTLKRYLDDIRKTAPLTREEEQILFQKAKEGDKIARQKLISANMRFVLKVAIQYRGCPIPLRPPTRKQSDAARRGAIWRHAAPRRHCPGNAGYLCPPGTPSRRLRCQAGTRGSFPQVS